MSFAFDREYYRNLKDVKKYPSLVKGVECFYRTHKRGYSVLCYEGRKSKASTVKYAANMHEVIVYIETFISSKCRANTDKEKQKQKNKLMKKENIDKCQPGNIYMTSWGYEQTNVDFFQVISKPTPASVIVRQIDQSITDDGFMSGKTKPLVDNFIGEEKTCRFSNDGSKISRIDDYGHTGYKCDPNKEYYISWGY